MLNYKFYKSAIKNPLFKLLWNNFWRYRKVTHSLRMLPDFIIIGAQRCGTSSLFQNIIQHPSVIPPLTQEIGFFQKNFERGSSWYKSYFPSHIRALSKAFNSPVVTGEGDSGYLFYPHCPEKVFSVNPDVKLVILLRNPVERAYLHYMRCFHRHRETMSFEEAIQLEAARIKEEIIKMNQYRNYYSPIYDTFAYLHKGLYTHHLKNWLSVFSREQLHIIKAENLFDNPSEVYQQVLNFLELPEWQPRHYRLAGLSNYPPMKTRTRDYLANYFKPHNEKLYELIGMDFGWDEVEGTATALPGRFL